MWRLADCDVLVLGAGGAGVTAAIAAAEAGMSVIILEKNSFTGGATNTIAVVRVVRDDPRYVDKAFQVHMEMTHWQGNPDLVRTWLEHDSRLADWMRERGVKFKVDYVNTLETMGQISDPLGGYPKGHLIAERAFLWATGNTHGGVWMMHTLLNHFEALGGKLYKSTPAIRLLMEDGKVMGAVARTKEGEEVEITAKAIVMATAGFNENAEMVKEYSGFDYTLDPTGTCTQGDFFFIWPVTKLMGDGLKMAWAIGAAKGPVGVAPFAHMPGPGIISRIPWNSESQLRIVQEQPYLWVNQKGMRFMDESIITDHFTSGRVVAQQPGKCAYMIFDEATKEHMEQVGLDYTYFIFAADRLTDLDGDIARVQAKGNKHVFVAENLDDLCRQTGINAQGLRETVERYNAYCAEGRDAQFAKEPRFLRPVLTGKIYCLRVYTTAYQTVGGLAVDGKTRVLNEAGDPIFGLYAAGDIIAASIFGEPPICGIGNAGIAMSTGMAAGENAADYVKKERTQ